MAKNFKVTVDITMSKDIIVKAESEDQAKTIAQNYVSDNPWYYAKTAEVHLDTEISSVVETDEEPEDEE